MADKIDNTDLAGLFAQLSEFFKEPTEEFAGDVASGRLLEYFKEIFLGPADFPLSHPLTQGILMSGDVHAALKEQYRRLFLGPTPPYIVPVESIYKKWSNDPECNLPIAGEKGYLMGDPAIDMIRRYQAHDMVIPDKYVSMPDHIALELEYMSFLCESGDIESQREFLLNHLDWIEELAKDIKDLDGNNFYSIGAEITAFVIARPLGFKNETLNRQTVLRFEHR
jgi:TorA maturation chaperone TorD